MKRILAGSAILIAITLLITGAYLRFSAIKFAVKSKSVAEIQKSAPVSAPVSTSGIFIVPPGGKEVNRDTAGQRVACRNIGDYIVIKAERPEALFVLMDTTRIRIDPVRTVIRIDALGGKDYLRFQNFGTKTERIKSKISRR